MNVEISLPPEASSSVFGERTTVDYLCNDMMMNRYVNLVFNFATDVFVNLAIQGDTTLCLFNAKTMMIGLCFWDKFVLWRKELH